MHVGLVQITMYCYANVVCPSVCDFQVPWLIISKVVTCSSESQHQRSTRTTPKGKSQNLDIIGMGSLFLTTNCNICKTGQDCY